MSPSNSQLDDWLAFALACCDEADALALAHFRRDLVIETDPMASFVTEADQAIERGIRDHITTAYPVQPAGRREYGDEPGGGSLRWYIDPIDGTHNFMRGVPLFGTLLAAEHDGELAVGVMSAPALGSRWYARRGGGRLGGRLRSDRRRCPPPRRRSRAWARSPTPRCSTRPPKRSPTVAWRRVPAAIARRLARPGFGDFWGYALVGRGRRRGDGRGRPTQLGSRRAVVVVEEAGGRYQDLGGGGPSIPVMSSPRTGGSMTRSWPPSRLMSAGSASALRDARISGRVARCRVESGVHSGLNSCSWCFFRAWPPAAWPPVPRRADPRRPTASPPRPGAPSETPSQPRAARTPPRRHRPGWRQRRIFGARHLWRSRSPGLSCRRSDWSGTRGERDRPGCGDPAIHDRDRCPRRRRFLRTAGTASSTTSRRLVRRRRERPDSVVPDHRGRFQWCPAGHRIRRVHLSNTAPTDDVSLGRWWLDPAGEAPTANTRELSILVRETDCASGHSPEGRVLPPTFVVRDDAIEVTIAIRRRPGDQDCQGLPAYPMRLELPEALGARSLFDASWYQPRLVTTQDPG